MSQGTTSSASDTVSEVESDGEDDAQALPEWEIGGEIWSPEDLVNALRAKDNQIDSLRDKLAARDDRIEELQAEQDRLARENNGLWEKLGELDDRTDMINVLEEAENPSADQMRARIMQHMWRMVKDEDGADRRYSMDVRKTTEVLHNPDVDRTTVLRWMRTTPRVVGDDTVCWYDGGDPGPTGEPAKIYLDLRDGAALPDDVVSNSNAAINRR